MTPRRTRGASAIALTAALGAVALLAVLAGLIAWLNVRGEAPLTASAVATDASTVARGAYLARIGDCAACHTARGGEDYAGGREVDTPFGTVYAPNLTPDPRTGLGQWTPAEFWRAMHHGRSKDGRLLYPAFPYPNFTLITREDSDALFAYLRSLPPVARPNTPHRLRFPYNLQASLAVWRALYFSPSVDLPDPAQSLAWNRGRYLVRGLGHCVACHSSRNALGATSSHVELGGGLIPMQNWYAPSLAASPHDALPRTQADTVALLRDGVTEKSAVIGPMAEVVYRSTQYMKTEDLTAIALFLQQLPPVDAEPSAAEAADRALWRAGEKLYADQCASCHGKQGEGVPHAYPALVGNREVLLASPLNVIKAILHGGFAPSTHGNPMPYGMPPFGPSLNDDELAAVASYIRQAWGQRASPVSPLDVHRAR